MPHDINYELHKASKSQAIADFIIQWTETQSLPPQVNTQHWVMYFDGMKMLTVMEARVILEGNIP